MLNKQKENREDESTAEEKMNAFKEKENEN